ncbi:MAG: P-type conjugative transfer protein VirB9 [Caulobacteraceae bacterium]
MKRLALSLALALTAAAPALAAQLPVPGVVDPRIRTVAYDPDEVVHLQGWFGFQMMIEFATDERIENVSIGDALGWQVTPNKKANLLFLKPIDRLATTNMTVVTDKRRYAFELTVSPDRARQAQMAYVIRFRYPQSGPTTVVDLPPAPVEQVLPPEAWNFLYTVTGSKSSAPATVFDDGHSTYFAWAPTAAVPGIFAIGPDGKESLVNYAIKGRYTVVDQVAPRFVLRSGAEVTTVVNGSYGAPKTSAQLKARPGG